MTARQHITFINSVGVKLAATIEHPAVPVKYYAIFAHCFTCGKDIIAASRVSKMLAARGVAVMRFDFTGIGDSDGDFTETNFSSNVQDLISASNFLRDKFDAPQLLIGHSLGGTAAIHAASEIPECKAVATIGSPATPNHLLDNFPDEVETIENKGVADINFGPKVFKIKKQFIDDLNTQSVISKISKLRKAILIMHSPIDRIVSIDEASRIFVAAKHPKSFITLDNADHLLDNVDDAQYVSETIIAWANRYIEKEKNIQNSAQKGEIIVGEGNHKFLREVSSDDHFWWSDEPKAVGGDNLGPDPYEQLLSALGTCTSMTMRMYANHKGWKVDDIQIQLSHSRQHTSDSEKIDDDNSKLEVVTKLVSISGELDEVQRKRLIEIADRCPVHKTLLGNFKIETTLM